MPSFDDYLGVDFVWIVVDAKGQLAAFITAGEGKVPYEVFEQDIIPPYAIEYEILEMPVVSGVIINIYMEDGMPSFFINLCQRGFFVYDWTGDDKRPYPTEYQLLTSLSKPIGIEQIANNYLNIFSTVVFKTSVFGEPFIDVKKFLRG